MYTFSGIAKRVATLAVVYTEKRVHVPALQVSREIIRVCAVYLHVAHEMFQITNVHVFRNGVWNCVY